MKMKLIYLFYAYIVVLAVATVVAYFVVPPRPEPEIYSSRKAFCVARADTATTLERRFCGYYD
jgi:hypothetical protein